MIHPNDVIEIGLLTDRETQAQIPGHSQYRVCIASRG